MGLTAQHQAQPSSKVQAISIGRAALASLSFSLVAAWPVHAESLARDFIKGLERDHEYQSAIAQRDAGLEPLEQARAALLPQISASAQRSINDTDSRSQSTIGPVDRSFDNYPSLSASLQIRQALFRPKIWASLSQAKAQAEYAQLNLLGAQQDLALRLLGVHAELAATSVTVASASQSLAIQQRMSEQIRRQFQAGDGTRADVEVMQARQAQAQSQLAEAQLQLENAKVALYQITASATDPIRLTGIAALRLPLMHANFARWLEASLEQNPLIRAQQAAIKIAQEELSKAQSEHMPTADLFAGRSRSKSAMDNTIGTEFRSSQIGVQLSVPIYAGGAVNSLIRQALANLRKAQSDLSASQSRLTVQLDRDWRSFESARTEAQAQARQLQALAVVLESTQRGQKAGIFTRMDEDQAQVQALAAQRDLARANARALVSWGRLMAGLGGLSVSSLEQADQALLKP